MKIFTISFTNTFSDTRVIKYIKHYLDRGHTVYCCGTDEEKNNFFNNNNFHYTRINFANFNIKNLLSISILLEILIFVLTVPSFFLSTFIYLVNKNKKKEKGVLLSTLYALLRYLKYSIFAISIPKENLSIIHIHDIWASPAAFIMKKKNLTAKIIIDLHELYSELPNQSDYKKMISKFFLNYIKLKKNKVSIIITINEEIKNYYNTNFNYSCLIINNSCEEFNIQNSIAIDKIPTKVIRLKDEGKKVLIYQGGLSPDRGIIEMCNFFLNFSPENWILLIMGDGKLVLEINNIITKTNNIFKIPAVSLNELGSYTKFADAGMINYTNNCLNHNFCNPNKLWEYSRCSLPMILSNCQSFINLNEKYQFAKIIDVNNTAQLSEIFKNLDNQELSRMSKNSKLFYDNNNWEKEKIKIDREILSTK